MRYTNPITGDHAMATMATFIQLLPKGFHTTAYRSTDATVFVPIKGRGRSTISTRSGEDFVIEWVNGTFSSCRAGTTSDTRRRMTRTPCFSRTRSAHPRWRSTFSERTAAMPKTTVNSQFFIPPPPVSSVAVAGTDARFAVRRIICVGRNYAAHARKMGRDPDREPPFFFLKPADTVVDDGATVPYPPETNNFHYEIELVAAIGKGGADIPVERAFDHVFGYGGRHRPDPARPAAPSTRAGTPLGLGEGVRPLRLDRAAPPRLRNRSSLRPGDLIMTGTPEGIGPVRRGEVMTGGIDGLGEIKIAGALTAKNQGPGRRY
jgi:fumarylpyruvate hydrolase